MGQSLSDIFANNYLTLNQKGVAKFVRLASNNIIIMLNQVCHIFCQINTIQ